MKKFMAIVMCLAMALSMMTVVSFAAVDPVPTISLGAAVEYLGIEDGLGDEKTEFNPGDVIAVPVILSDRLGLAGGSIELNWNPEYLSMSDAMNEDYGCYECYPETPLLFNQMCDTNVLNVANGSVVTAGAKKGAAYGTSSKNFSLGYYVFTVLDAAAGKDVTISFGAKTIYNDGSDCDYAAKTGLTFKVAGAVVTDPTATIVNVPVEPTEEGGVVTVLQVAGNATEFGVTYDGVDYPSAAKAADLANYNYFAVELIGATGAITAYAK